MNYRPNFVLAKPGSMNTDINIIKKSNDDLLY